MASYCTIVHLRLMTPPLPCIALTVLTVPLTHLTGDIFGCDRARGASLRLGLRLGIEAGTTVFEDL